MISKFTHQILGIGINIPILLISSAIHAQSPTVIENQGLLPSIQSTNRQNILPEIKPYSLGPGDIIRVSVYDLPDQGGDFQIFTDGTVSIPLIGTFNIAGKTVQEVYQLFTKEYARFLKRPAITVTLMAQRPLKLAIAGEVNIPGKYTLNPDLGDRKRPKVTDLLEKAGGLTISANVREILLKRQEEKGERIYTIDFWQLLQQGDLKQDVDLQDGDVIIIPKQETINVKEYRQLVDANFGIKFAQPPNITIVGEVNRPGAYTVPIETGPPRLTIALQQSGGIREMANIRQITVNRTTRDGQEQNIEINLWEMLETGDVNKDIVLQNGDTIIVPRAEELDPTEAQTIASANFSPAEITVNVVGSVRKPGALKITPNSSLNAAILASGGFDERRANNSVVQLVRVNPNGTVTKRDVNVNLSAGVNEQTNPILKNNDVIIVNRNGITAFSDSFETILGPIGRTFSVLNLFNVFSNN
ncbi:putative polysaccharide export protein [Geminocystis sp. NIES-3708]|uniref:SLBB domain-containing protein n=1 Tax=Geminocystis sp. NIES-3708 TaxID=1615909 RepID=UPI0005FC5189|nr:SLBB domain-containing protein [Geminocystis sp. NIES-3708]BAQ60857.1 putative polysaccharide export protein [Geminocystis sp. NIES-3708]